MSALAESGIAGMRGAALVPPDAEQDAILAWWARLVDAVGALAQRYPRTYGSTIPATWAEDAETVELLALITRWRAELDAQDSAAHEGVAGTLQMQLDGMLFPESGIEHARRAWEWHALRDGWLRRLAETGRAPIGAGAVEPRR